MTTPSGTALPRGGTDLAEYLAHGRPQHPRYGFGLVAGLRCGLRSDVLHELGRADLPASPATDASSAPTETSWVERRVPVNQEATAATRQATIANPKAA